MSTSGDEALEKALEHLKVRNSDYLQNQTLTTHSNLAGAMGRKIRALASTRDMIKQTSEMSQVKQDFENSTNPRKKIRIAHTLAETLVKQTAKTLVDWTIQQAISATGDAYAMYDIDTNGEVIDWLDTTGDGLLDTTILDTNGLAGGENAVGDGDGDGILDRIFEVDAGGAIGEVVAEESMIETVFGVLTSIFE